MPPYRARQRASTVPNTAPMVPMDVGISNTVSVTGSVTSSITGSVTLGSLYPAGSTPMISASGNVANATASATLNGFASATTYVSGFEVTGAGATAGLPVVVTVTGLSATLSYIYSAAVGALVENTPLLVAFSPPLPASTVSTAIVVSCPPLGTGNTNNAVVIRGFRV